MKSRTLVLMLIVLILCCGVASAAKATYYKDTVKILNDKGSLENYLVIDGLKDIIVYNGGYLYCTSSTAIQVYDIRVPAKPKLMKVVTPGANTLSLKGIYLYAGGKDLSVYSLASPLSPRLVNIKSLPSPATESEIYNGYLYLYTASGVVIVKV